MLSNEQAVVSAKEQIAQLKSAYMTAAAAYIQHCESEPKDKLIGHLLNVHKCANEYFNYTDEFVGNSGLLGAHENALWVTGFAEDCLATLDSLIAHYVFLRGAYAKLSVDLGPSLEPSSTSYANLQRMVKEYLPKQISQNIEKQLRQNNLPTLGFSHKARGMATGLPAWQLITGVAIGIVALILVSIGAVLIPSPTEWQMFIFRGIFALALSAIAAIVPGFIDVKSKVQSEYIYTSLRAGGAIAVFIIVWFINPPVLIQARVPNEKPELGRLLQELESQSIERRILAVSQIANILPKNQIEADYTVRVLESYINRHGTREGRSTNNSQNQDISAAFLSLGSILKYAESQAFEIRPPEFKELDLSNIDLTNAYLRRATFIDSTLDDTTLNGADLSDSFLTGVQFSRVQAQDIKLIAANVQQICAEGAIFLNADLSGIKISSSDFNGANFKNANLSSARFENSSLLYVNLDGANMAHSDLRTALELTKRQLQNTKSANTATFPDPIFIKSKLSICKI